MVERKANVIPRANKDLLMAAAESAWDEIPEETVRASCTNAIKRFRAVARANGGHVE